MIKEFTDRISKLGGKELLGVKVKTEKSSEKRVPIYPYFEETFKFIEMIEQERERRRYDPSFEERLELLKKYKGAIKDEADLDEYEAEERRLERLIKLQHGPMRITIPEDKYKIILENHAKEDEIVRDKTKSLMTERNEIRGEIERLTEIEEDLDQEVKTNIKLIKKANMIKKVLEDHGRSFDIGVTADDIANDKRESEYMWAEIALNHGGGKIQTYKTIKDGEDK